MRRACVFTLTEDVRATLERWSRSRSTEARLAERARIVLLAAEGRENKDIAVELGVTVRSVEISLKRASMTLREECLRHPAFSRSKHQMLHFLQTQISA